MRFNLWLAYKFDMPAFQVKENLCPDCLKELHNEFLTLSN